MIRHCIDPRLRVVSTYVCSNTPDREQEEDDTNGKEPVKLMHFRHTDWMLDGRPLSCSFKVEVRWPTETDQTSTDGAFL